MARYTGPREKIARRFGVPLFGPSKALELRKVELEQWIRDLSVTERTLARILDVDLPDVETRQIAMRRKKPADIPSIHEMAVSIIRDRGEAVEAQEIIAGIRKRWWPEATNNDVSPTLWRLATKDNRLTKNGTRYGLPITSASLKKLSPFPREAAE